MSSPTFLEYVKNSMPNETDNYQAVMFKACIESGFNDDIREGKSKPYAANPPVVSTKELCEKLILSNIETFILPVVYNLDKFLICIIFSVIF